MHYLYLYITILVPLSAGAAQIDQSHQNNFSSLEMPKKTLVPRHKQGCWQRWKEPLAYIATIIGIVTYATVTGNLQGCVPAHTNMTNSCWSVSKPGPFLGIPVWEKVQCPLAGSVTADTIIHSAELKELVEKDSTPITCITKRECGNLDCPGNK